MMDIAVVKDIDIWIYIHEVGEEYFLHFDYWPTIPIKHYVRPEDTSTDIMAQKEIKSIEENCNHDEEYSYFGIVYCNRGSNMKFMPYKLVYLRKYNLNMF